MARLEGRGWAGAVRAYAPSLLPIAFGYHLAHYFSYLLIEGQLVIAIASDPFGRGWDLFGTSGHRVDILDVDMRAIWAVALLGVIGGHVVGVIAAHRIALRRVGDAGRAWGRAWRAHAPLVAAMVCYTVFSLWILSQPIVKH